MTVIRLGKHWDEVDGYAQDIVSGRKIACQYQKKGVLRFLKNLHDERYDFDAKDADFCIDIIEKTMCHQQGESLDGTPLRGTPFLLQPFQKYIIYNLVGFKGHNSKVVRFHEALIYMPRKNGKAVSLDTELPTPNGWKKMADIHEGDIVFGADGKPSKVLLESEIFNKKMYLVTFEDGATVKASADHVWTVQTSDSRRTSRYVPKGEKVINKMYRPELRGSNGWFDITTEEMVNDFVRHRPDGKGSEYKYRVPMCKPVEYPKKDLLIDPYTLGVWLGDGTSKSTDITCSDADKGEMMANIVSFGHTVKWHGNKNRAGCFSIDTGTRGGHHKNVLRENLRQLGVFKDKHIPEEYMQGSVEQRLLLLQGLMDTDGTISKTGQCSFTQKDERLSRQVKELCESLGIKASLKERKVTCNGKPAGTAWQVSFFTDQSMPCFRLARKKARLKESLAPRMQAKSIVGIKEIPVEPSKCIMVDNESHLYLVGRDYTTTHNTGFAGALAWALALLYRRSGSKCYIASAALIQSMESFNFMTYNIKNMGEWDKEGGSVHINDNHNDHSFSATLPDGSFFVKALAASADKQDSLNCNTAILDEIHAFKQPKQYNLFQQAMKSYSNKLLIGISTAGDNAQGFLGKRLEYCKKVLDGIVEDEQYFIFICEADPDPATGEVDYTNPDIHEMANPNYGITIRPQEILNDSLQAQNDPQSRKDFFAKSLNVFTNDLKAYFDIEEFRRSDAKYNWTLEELAHLPIRWYGGADLSRTYDLTAACLFGQYQGVDIVITHAFFPRTMAVQKADEDGIPLFGWQDDGWLTMCNSPTVNMGDIVQWFIDMRSKGFKISMVGHDRKFAQQEYFPMMKKSGFIIKDIPQYFYLKSQGFRHIEHSVKNGQLYYLHSEAYEYCVSNVRAVEKTDDAVQYDKVQPEHRIDLFDASVFACIAMEQGEERQTKISNFFG